MKGVEAEEETTEEAREEFIEDTTEEAVEKATEDAVEVGVEDVIIEERKDEELLLMLSFGHWKHCP